MSDGGEYMFHAVRSLWGWGTNRDAGLWDICIKSSTQGDAERLQVMEGRALCKVHVEERQFCIND